MIAGIGASLLPALHGEALHNEAPAQAQARQGLLRSEITRKTGVLANSDTPAGQRG
jgi:hypothetical protein